MNDERGTMNEKRRTQNHEQKTIYDERGTMNEKDSRDLRLRTKTFALRIVRLYSSLPRTTQAQVLGRQALRSGTSVGAHYREAKRARSTAEFVSKIEAGLQELEETIYWLELLQDAQIIGPARLRSLLKEAEELVSIFVASAKTAKKSV